MMGKQLLFVPFSVLDPDMLNSGHVGRLRFSLNESRYQLGQATR